MEAANFSDWPAEVMISRCPDRRCWVVSMEERRIPLPWADSADACMVALWLKANAGGKLDVRVRL